MAKDNYEDGCESFLIVIVSYTDNRGATLCSTDFIKATGSQ
jgi:hypothetical protein